MFESGNLYSDGASGYRLVPVTNYTLSQLIAKIEQGSFNEFYKMIFLLDSLKNELRLIKSKEIIDILDKLDTYINDLRASNTLLGENFITLRQYLFNENLYLQEDY